MAKVGQWLPWPLGTAASKQGMWFLFLGMTWKSTDLAASKSESKTKTMQNSKMPLQVFWKIISKMDFKMFTKADVKTSTVIPPNVSCTMAGISTGSQVKGYGFCYWAQCLECSSTWSDLLICKGIWIGIHLMKTSESWHREGHLYHHPNFCELCLSRSNQAKSQWGSMIKNNILWVRCQLVLL